MRFLKKRFPIVIIVFVFAINMFTVTGMSDTAAESSYVVKDIGSANEYIDDNVSVIFSRDIVSGKITADISLSSARKNIVVSGKVTNSIEDLNFVFQDYTDSNGEAIIEYINNGSSDTYNYYINIPSFNLIVKKPYTLIDTDVINSIYTIAMNADKDNQESINALKTAVIDNCVGLNIDLGLYNMLNNKDSVFDLMVSELTNYKSSIKNTNDVVDAFEAATFIAAIQQGVLTIKDTIFDEKYERFYNLDETMPKSITDSSKPIIAELDAKIQDNVYAELLNAGSFENIVEFRDELALLTLTEGINKAISWKNVEPLLKAYANSSKINVSFTKFDKLKNKSSVLIGMMGQPYTSYGDIETLYNDLLNEASISGGNISAARPSGSGGGGGFSSKTSGTSVTVPASGNTNEMPKTNEVKSEQLLTFVDMDNAKWAIEAVEALYKMQIISKNEENCFMPNNSITRAEAAKMFVLLGGLDIENVQHSFADVDENHWSYKYVASAQTNGLISGYNNQFRCDDFITRQEIAVIGDRVLQMKGVTIKDAIVTEFSDAEDIASWAYPSVHKLHKAFVINGRGSNTFEPEMNLTRAEAAVIVYRISKLINK